jgi:hypothetical protein
MLMKRMFLVTLSTACFVTVLLSAAMSGANAQGARSYCLIHPGGEPGGCGFPTLEACLADSAGFGTCIGTERPASWAPPATAMSTMSKRRG